MCNRSQHHETIRWEAPPLGVYKINVDGAVSEDGRVSSVGVIIRNNKGDILQTPPRFFSSMETEIFALEIGILLAKEMQLSQIIIESDALSVVQDLQNKETNGSVGQLYLGIYDLLKSFRSWSIKHLKRDTNKVAHELAHYARCNGTTQVWKGCAPPMIQHLIHLDCS